MAREMHSPAGSTREKWGRTEGMGDKKLLSSFLTSCTIL